MFSLSNRRAQKPVRLGISFCRRMAGVGFEDWARAEGGSVIDIARRMSGKAARFAEEAKGRVFKAGRTVCWQGLLGIWSSDLRENRRITSAFFCRLDFFFSCLFNNLRRILIAFCRLTFSSPPRTLLHRAFGKQSGKAHRNINRCGGQPSCGRQFSSDTKQAQSLISLMQRIHIDVRPGANIAR